jgi:enoyl-CoA hydratase/carnithine racemase
MPASDLVRYETSDHVATITLNRPERGNAWTGAMEVAYRQALDRAAGDDDIGAIVLTGAGERFCVGADSRALDKISVVGTYDDGTAGSVKEADRGRHSTLWEIPKPVIAAINGAAAGVGFVLLAFADLRIAAAGAKLTTSNARLGLPAELGLSWLLPRIVGTSHAADLLLTSRVITAEEALTMGLVNRVVPADQLGAEAQAWAAQIATNLAPSSLRVVKEQLYADLQSTIAEAEARYHRHLSDMVGSADFNEGVAALTERRPPHFRP